MGLEATIKQFIDSLLASKTRHTLCLNIADPAVDGEKIAFAYLQSKSAGGLHELKEPTPTALSAALEMIAGRHLVLQFDDLDKHPKCIDILSEFVKKDTGGKLVVVSRHWDSDNTEKERTMRKSCLFYQQNFAPPPKNK